MEQTISVGNNVQVYCKGEAYSGCLVAFGKVVSIEEDQNGKCYEIEGSNESGENEKIFYSAEEYDIVLVSLTNPFFAKHYMTKSN